MMIVMKETATDEEIEAVVEKIERAGALAHRSRGRARDRDRRDRRRRAGRQRREPRPGGPAGRRPRGADPQALQARLRADHATASAPCSTSTGARSAASNFALIAGPCTVESREQMLADRARRARRGRDAAARRRLQAAHLALRLPGPRPGGPAAARRGQGGDRPADRHRADGRARPRRRAGGRRRDPDRRAQHAELPAAGRDRPLRAPGAAQARALLDARRAADGGRVHPQGGQPQRDAVRARASARSRPPTASRST